MTTRWERKDLLGLRELSREEITLVLETADAFKEVGTREVKKVPALQGKTLVNLFIEPSTRTRTSFELAAKRLIPNLSGVCVYVSGASARSAALAGQIGRFWEGYFTRAGADFDPNRYAHVLLHWPPSKSCRSR